MVHSNKHILHSFLLLLAFICTHHVSGQQQDKEKILAGIVKDASTGAPLAGISITVEGKASAITESDGTYKINVPATNSIIEVSGLGYKTRDISVRGRDTINISLFEAGYKGSRQEVYTATGDKSSTQITNSLGVINENNDLSVAVTPDALLQGYASGVNTIFRSGMPGNGSNIYIRGFNTMNAGVQPLIVIDGMPVENSGIYKSLIGNYQANPLASVDIKDIESISVMKDGVGLYGLKGGNGVILIKTRKSQSPETNIMAHVHTGVSFEPDQLPVLSGSEQRNLLTDVIQSVINDPQWVESLPFINTEIPVKQKWGYEGNVDYYRYNNNTNWQDQIYSGKWNTNAYVNVSGGDEVALYNLSIGFLNQNGVVNSTRFQRFNTRFNSTVKLSPKFEFLTNMSFVYGTKNLGNEGADINKNPIFAALVKSPLTNTHVYTQDGLLSPNIESADIFGNSNPYALVNNTSIVNVNYRFMGSFEFLCRLNKNFSFSEMFGLNFNKEREKAFYPSVGVFFEPQNGNTITNESQHRVDRLFTLYNDFHLDYKTLPVNNNQFNVRVGLRYQNNDAENDYGEGFNSSSDDFKSIQYGAALLRQVGGTLGKWNWLTAYASANYSLKNKYFIDLSVSEDATSRSGEDAAPFFLYPSVSGAWLVSGEQFLKSASWLSLMKLRVSYGLSGNDEIGNYSALRYYTPQNLLGTYGLVRGNLVNTELKPETVERINAGLDLSVLNERITLSVDVFSNKTTDMMLNNIPEVATGFYSYLSNGGSMENKGIDIGLNTRVINGKFKWDLGLMVSKYKNKVLDLNGQTFETNILGATVLTEVGKPLGQFYGYKTNGVYSTSAEANEDKLYAMQGLVPIQYQAGDVRFVNQNSDNLIDENDKVVIGDPNPDFYGSVSSQFKYNRWSLNAFFTYAYGNDIYNYTRSQLENMSTFNNQSQAVLNRWRYEGMVTDIPKATYGDPMGNSSFSDRWIEDGSYIRLRSLQLSYDFKIRKSSIQNCSVFVIGENLLTLTNYKGLDPEFALGQNPLYYGIDACFVPQPKIVSVGVKLSL